jgi:hypothetical protein
MLTGFWWGKLNEGDDMDVDRGIILKKDYE